MADDDSVDMAARALDLADSWGTVDLDPSQIQELRRALETAWGRGRGRLADTPRTSYCWGLRKGEWWLVEYANGEPHAAYHQLHGRIIASRQSFTHWSPNADGPRPSDCERGADAMDVLEAAHALRLLEAAHALRLLGCEGESAVDVMVDAARHLSLPEGSVSGTIADQAWGLARAIEGANGGRTRELIKEALLAAWGAGRRSTADRLESLDRGAERCFRADMTPEEHQASAEAYQRDILESATLDAHAECAEELRAVGCRGETTTAVMTHAVERLKGLMEADLFADRLIDKMKREAKAACDAATTLQHELTVAEHTLASIRAELRDSHSRLQAVRDAVREN